MDYFPLDIAIPYVGFMYLTQFASRVEIGETYIEGDFNLEHLGLLDQNQRKILKKIAGDYPKPLNFKGEEPYWQLYINDNFYNSFVSVITSSDKVFSARSSFKSFPQARPAFNMLTTSNIGKVFPVIVEQFGPDKNIDIIFSSSHDLFLEGIPDAKPSIFTYENGGVMKLQANIPLQMTIELPGKKWEAIRNIFITVVLEGYMETIDGSNGQIFTLGLKTAKISQVVIKNLEGETMEMEQMLIQSMANLQLEKAKKDYFKVR